MKRKRWKYKVYFRGSVVKTFASRKAARHFMEHADEFDLPLVMPWDTRSELIMIGELK
jgi:hypothetical protein